MKAIVAEKVRPLEKYNLFYHQLHYAVTGQDYEVIAIFRDLDRANIFVANLVGEYDIYRVVE